MTGLRDSGPWSAGSRRRQSDLREWEGETQASGHEGLVLGSWGDRCFPGEGQAAGTFSARQTAWGAGSTVGAGEGATSPAFKESSGPCWSKYPQLQKRTKFPNSCYRAEWFCYQNLRGRQKLKTQHSSVAPCPASQGRPLADAAREPDTGASEARPGCSEPGRPTA